MGVGIDLYIGRNAAKLQKIHLIGLGVDVFRFDYARDAYFADLPALHSCRIPEFYSGAGLH
jgi:hypothetical protein